MNTINHGPIGKLELPLTSRLKQDAPATSGTPNSFPDLLASGVDQVNTMQHDAQSQVQDLLTGGDVSKAEVFTSVQKADMAFRMLVQVRNKLLAAYEEVNAIRV